MADDENILELGRRLAQVETALAGLATKSDLEVAVATAAGGLATKAELTTGLSDLRTEIAAIKFELADKPGKMWLATAIGVLLVAYAAGLAGLAALPVITKRVQP